MPRRELFLKMQKLSKNTFQSNPLKREQAGSNLFFPNERPWRALNLKKMYDAGALIAVGTDAGNPGTLHGISIYDEMEAMQKAGISPNDLIVMATRNGAIAMDRIDDFGTLESGKNGGSYYHEHRSIS